MRKNLIKSWVAIFLALFMSGGAYAGSCKSLTQAMKDQAQKASANGDINGSLEFAAMTGDVDGVRTAVSSIKQKESSSVGNSGTQRTLNKALYDAAMAGEVSTLQALVDAGANIKAADAPAIIGAAECGQIESMRVLVKLGADVSQRADIEVQANVPSTPLETALGGNEFKAASWLLNHGADVCSAPTRNRLGRFIQSPTVRKGLSTEDFEKLRCNS